MISAYTERETVISDEFADHVPPLDARALGPRRRARSARCLGAAAHPGVQPKPRPCGRPSPHEPPSLDGVDKTRGVALGDNPDLTLLRAKGRELVSDQVSHLGAVVLDNLVRLTGRSEEEVPRSLPP